MRQYVAPLWTLRPGPPRRRAGFVTALCTFLPIVIGQAVDRPGLGLVATLGALAALYGGKGSARQDTSAVAAAAVAIIAATAAGASVAGDEKAAVLVTALWTVVATAGCAVVRARQPGMIMLVLVCAIASSLPPGNYVPFLLSVVVTAIGATLLTWTADLIVDGRASRAGKPVRRALSDGAHDILQEIRRLPSGPAPFSALRDGVGIFAAGALALAVGCGLGRSSWAMAVAASVLGQGAHARSVNQRAAFNCVGTAIGCLLAGAAVAVRPTGVGLAFLLAALTFVTEQIVARNYAVALIFITPLSVLLVEASGPPVDALSLTWNRFLETLIGCAAALAVGQLVSRRWVVRHRLRAVVDTLTAAADAWGPDAYAPSSAKGPTAELDRARKRLILVGERSAAERPDVRRAAASLDAVASEALRIAEQVLTRHGRSPEPPARHGRSPEPPRKASGPELDPEPPLILRQFARRLQARDAERGPEESHRDRSDVVPAGLVPLGHAVEEWTTHRRAAGK